VDYHEFFKVFFTDTEGKTRKQSKLGINMGQLKDAERTIEREFKYEELLSKIKQHVDAIDLQLERIFDCF
jgi:hypothetical protein